MDPSLFSAALMQWATQSPALVVYFVGAVIALTFWQRHRVAAVLTLWAMVLLAALTLAMPIIMLNLPRWQSEHYWGLKQMGFVSTAISLFASLIHAVSGGLLLAAVFHRRSATAVNAPSNLPPPLPLL